MLYERMVLETYVLWWLLLFVGTSAIKYQWYFLHLGQCESLFIIHYVVRRFLSSHLEKFCSTMRVFCMLWSQWNLGSVTEIPDKYGGWKPFYYQLPLYNGDSPSCVWLGLESSSRRSTHDRPRTIWRLQPGFAMYKGFVPKRQVTNG